MGNVELSPEYILNNEWKPTGKIISESGLAYVHADEYRRLRSLRIEVADHATTKKIGSDAESEYLKTQLGMNIILPKGRIEELRFKITLKGDGEIGNGVYAIDGFPNDKIEQSYILSGKIGVGIDKALEFIPLALKANPSSAPIAVPVEILQKLLKFEVNPVPFNLGYSENVKVDFSGGNTSTPEWYFKGDGILHNLNVAITIKKPIGIKKIVADIEAAWIYNEDPWPWPDNKYGSAPKTVTIYDK